MKSLREGFTTGACAAACALASCLWRRDGVCPSQVSIQVPAGKTYVAEIHPLDAFCCAVYKDAGDDPDITDGSEVWARAEVSDGPGPVAFLAGAGVGVVTLPGLKVPVGEPAINPVPRRMIQEAVRGVYPDRAVSVTVGITGGEALAEKTFNPRLGVRGGLSILGTTGVVRPMSEEALTEAIRLEIGQRKAQGFSTLGLVFGSQGEEALKALFPDLPCVQMSNFVGSSLDAAAEAGFARVVLSGQPGKLVKVSGGCMQTHSQYGDGRRETLCAHLSLLQAPLPLLSRVMDSPTLEGLIPVIRAAGYEQVWDRLCLSASRYAKARVKGKMKIDTLMLDSGGRRLGAYRDEE